MPTFRPLTDQILLKKIDSARKTPGGILLPDAQQQSAQTHLGSVVAKGPGKHTLNGTFIPTTLAVGDVVAYVPGHAAEIYLGGESWFVVHEEHLLSRVEL